MINSESWHSGPLRDKARRALELEAVMMFEEAKQSPISYVDNFFYTFDPKRAPFHLRFKLFEFQHELIQEVQMAIDNGYDLFIEKSREMGATYCILATFLWFWWKVPGSNFLVGSRKEAYVDNRGAKAQDEISNKEESLFGKMDYMVSRLPAIALPKMFDTAKHMPYMSLKNPEIGNVISGESTNQNFSRGGRFKAILLDEFAFWDNDGAAWGSTADTTNCRIVLTTPGIKPSTKAKRLRFGEDGEIIKVLSFHARRDPRKDEAYFKRERERRSEDDYAREINIDWEGSIKGRVYSEIKYAILGEYPLLPQSLLYTSWDFGMDGVALQWWQFNRETLKLRLIDSYFNTDKPIQFYFPFFDIAIECDNEYCLDGHLTRRKIQDYWMLEKCPYCDTKIKFHFEYTPDDIKAIEVLRKYRKQIHYGDPDVSKRSLLTGTTTRQELAKVGIHVKTNTKANDFISRRESTKVLLQRGVEINETPRNQFFMDCIKNATYPERSDNSQATSPITKPIHDWTSHHRTSLEYFAVNFNKKSEEDGISVKDPPKDSVLGHILKKQNDRLLQEEYVGY